MFKIPGISICFVAVLVCFAHVVADAQTKAPPGAARGMIVGNVVVDENGEALGECVVSIVGRRYGALTDTTGFYRIPDVPPGTYRLQFSYVGFRPGEVDSIVLRPFDTVRVDYRVESVCSPWADSARKDLAAGKVRILVAGLMIVPYPTEEEKNITRIYGFEYDYSGCAFMCADEYNKVVEAYLTRRNGSGWQTSVRKDLDRLRQRRR